jgi:Uma2 family endonuclease
VYDREVKRDAYIALGVQEVWLVDRWSKVVEVSRRRGPGTITNDVLRWQIPTHGVDIAILLTDVFAGL